MHHHQRHQRHQRDPGPALGLRTRHLFAAPVWAAAALCLASAGVQAADPACAALSRAARAGMQQARIHAVIDAPLDPEALKIGMKPTLLHSIVIDQQQHSNALTPTFRTTTLKSAAERELASDLAVFEPDAGCQVQGPLRLAGRDALRYTFGTDLGRGEARVTVWVDTATGLPLRALTDEPDVDVGAAFNKAGASGRAVEIKEKPNGKRVVATHAYLFGAAVRAPGPQGVIDTDALARLQQLLKGAP
jgi:hypothetical protein